MTALRLSPSDDGVYDLDGAYQMTHPSVHTHLIHLHSCHRTAHFAEKFAHIDSCGSLNGDSSTVMGSPWKGMPALPYSIWFYLMEIFFSFLICQSWCTSRV
ncbi:TPA: hypothetical protein ACH3X1_014116 [Trebouxia sp. C0004]